jgi:hypothetical protein
MLLIIDANGMVDDFDPDAEYDAEYDDARMAIIEARAEERLGSNYAREGRSSDFNQELTYEFF